MTTGWLLWLCAICVWILLAHYTWLYLSGSCSCMPPTTLVLRCQQWTFVISILWDRHFPLTRIAFLTSTWFLLAWFLGQAKAGGLL